MKYQSYFVALILEWLDSLSQGFFFPVSSIPCAGDLADDSHTLDISLACALAGFSIRCWCLGSLEKGHSWL